MRSIIGALLLSSVCYGQQTQWVPVDTTVTIDDITQDCTQSVCMVDAKQSQNAGEGFRGSGVYIGSRWVLTAFHVVESPSGGNLPHITCTFGAGQYAVDECVWSRDCDTAILRLTDDPPSRVRAIPIADSDPPIGGWVCFAGFDHGRRYRVFDGVCKEYRQSGDAVASHENGKNSISGNSGGPVFNNVGHLIGNLHSKSAPGTWINGQYVNTPDPMTTAYVSNRKVRAFLQRVSERYPQYQLPSWGSQPTPGQACPPQQPVQPSQPQCPPCKDGAIGPAGPQGPPGPPGECECDEAYIQQLVNVEVQRRMAEMRVGITNARGDVVQTIPFTDGQANIPPAIFSLKDTTTANPDDKVFFGDALGVPIDLQMIGAR